MANRKPESNQAFIKRLADNNILKEVFIIAAIDSYARQVADSERMEHGFIDGAAWQQVAREILKDLETR